MIKLLITGSGNTGTTSLQKRITDGYFDEKIICTIGVDYYNSTIRRDGKQYKFMVWSASNSFRYENIINYYLKHSEFIIFCYDITKRETFEEIVIYNNALKKVNKDAVVYLVGTKKDLKCKRVVTYDEGFKLATMLNMIFYEVSAKTGENVDEIINSIIFHYKNKEIEREENIKKEKDKNNLFYNLFSCCFGR